MLAPSSEEPRFVERFRMSTLGRISSLAFGLGWAGISSLMLWATANGTDPGRWVIVAIAGPALFALAAYFVMAWRAEVMLTNDGVTIQNPFRRFELAWHEVRTVTATQWGLLIEGSEGRIVASAVQKANYKIMQRRRSRADDVAERITLCAQDPTARTVRSEI